MVDQIGAVLEQIGAYLFSFEFLYSPLYIPTTVLIAFLLWKARGGKAGFFAYFAPRELYRHPSTRIDIALSSLVLALSAVGVFAVFYLGPVVTVGLLLLLENLGGGGRAEATGVAGGLLAVVVLFLTQDFCRFVTHYLHHKSSVIWPFHAVHHSAEILTPVTFLRGHPVYYAIQQVVMSLLIGAAQALVLFLFVGRIELWVVQATTLAFQGYMLLGGHLRHSHIQLSYGRFLEHILISPAQHQVHHSSDPKHFDKNFGEIFAIWDWMFGTLYIPQRYETLVFGIGDGQGRPIAQPYPTVRDALIKPFRESAAALRPGRRAALAGEANTLAVERGP